MQSGNINSGQTALLSVIADLGTEVNNGQSAGTAIQKILTRDRVPAMVQNSVRASLLANWYTVREFGLATPENLERMRSGKTPVVTIGALRGQETVVVASGDRPGPSAAGYQLVPRSLKQTIVSASGSSVPPPHSAMPAEIPPPKATVDFVVINRGESVKFAKYGGGTEEAFINAANEKDGVVYAMVDPAKMKVEHYGTNPQIPGVDYVKRIPNTKTYTAAWNFAPVPGLTEKGIYLTTYAGASLYFLGSTDNVGGDRYRLCVVTAVPAMRFPLSSPFPKRFSTPRPATGAH